LEAEIIAFLLPVLNMLQYKLFCQRVEQG